MENNGDHSKPSLADMLDEYLASDTAGQKIEQVIEDFRDFLQNQEQARHVEGTPISVVENNEVDEWATLRIEPLADRVARLNRKLTKEDAEFLKAGNFDELSTLKLARDIYHETYKNPEYRLDYLASIYAVVKQYMAEFKIDYSLATAIKKRLQAGSLAEGEAPVWRDLIAEKFPGDSLTGDETDLVISEATGRSFHYAETMQLYNRLNSYIVDRFLTAGESLSDIMSPESCTYIGTLIWLVYESEEYDNPKDIKEVTDSARQLAAQSGLDLAVCNDLIIELFGVENYR